jgi:thymidylate synthase (FAD)
MRHNVPAADDLLDKQFPVLDHGFVILTDYMGSDAAIAEAARVSLAGEGTKRSNTDRGLIRYLMAKMHTSPFEMVEFKFHCAMPIFVARQWIRHRTANVNEMSGRYSELPELTYVPEAEQIAYQNPTNKQGRGDAVSTGIVRDVRSSLREDAERAFARYHSYLGKPGAESREIEADINPPTFTVPCVDELQANGGISRELARINLPLSTYTQWYWKIDLHNLLHFLFLRLDEHAQWEIRQYANVMATVVEALCPIAWEAFKDYRLDAIRLSSPELEAAGYLLDKFHAGQAATLEGHRTRMSNRELDEFEVKLARIGLGFLNGSVKSATLRT